MSSGIAVGPADHGVGLDADLAQRGDRVLRGLGLQLAGRADEGHQGDVQEEAVVAADVVAGLAGRLQERQRLDVADGAADLRDHHVDLGLAHRQDAFLDLVGDVRDHLHGVAEVVAAALLGDHARVDLAGRDIGDLAEVGVEEPLVVADVEIGLGAVVGHEDLAVLERVHRAGVDVEIGVEFLHRHPETAAQQAAEAGGRQALAEGGGDASGNEDVLGGLRHLPGFDPIPAPGVHGNTATASARVAPRRTAPRRGPGQFAFGETGEHPGQFPDPTRVVERSHPSGSPSRRRPSRPDAGRRRPRPGAGG